MGRLELPTADLRLFRIGSVPPGIKLGSSSYSMMIRTDYMAFRDFFSKTQQIVLLHERSDGERLVSLMVEL